MDGWSVKSPSEVSAHEDYMYVATMYKQGRRGVTRQVSNNNDTLNMSSFDAKAARIFASLKEELLSLQDDRPQLIKAWRSKKPLGPSISRSEWDTQLERLLGPSNASSHKQDADKATQLIL